ncbi:MULTISPECIES: DUF2267 domain-containing protein [Streptomyces]|uniref:DUF2267 domain-containing protein n=1 Tax=Streptomyces TaxID=1883 RepID=UPI00160274BC|nr:DUF2267 domain-containing protein [Streptomyces murinus]MBA9046060.1 uncharacterized protein (DUF2267 family) [Streptomyces murinus]
MTTTVPKPAVRPTAKNATAPRPVPSLAREDLAAREGASRSASKDLGAPESALRAGRENAAAPKPAPRTTWEALTEAVRETGGYPTRAQAEHLTRLVLTALGTHLTGDERVALAQSLPPEAGHLIASQIPLPHPLTAREFVDSVSTQLTDSTPATARWDVSSVLTAVSTTIGPALTDQVLSQLPRGYALLFGRAELAAAMA